MFDELILHGDKFYAKTPHDEKNIILKIRLPWYRCLPVSVIDKIDIAIDGKAVQEGSIKVLIAGEPKTIPEIKKYTRLIWSNLETQDVQVTLDMPIAQGAHEIQLDLRVDLPYKMPEDDPPYYYQFATCSKTMEYVRG